ncbi:MAG: tungsten ABC transporter substrate-binding protein, partial [Gemmatimonas sp. SM23_52]
MALALALALVSCSTGRREVVLASTTSTEDSGLFEVLLPGFQRARPGYRVRVIAVGSGEALRLAERGDADAVLAHSPRAEERFMAAGHGESRRPVMFNDFVIVGPEADVAVIRGLSGAATAFARIAGSAAPFISRGDDSGTHARERLLWDAARIEPAGSWYLEAGQGMGAVLMMASEKQAYTLTDRGTYLSLRDRLELSVLVEGDPALRNQYSVIVVRGAANPDGARA